MDEFKARLPYLREQVAPKLGPNGKPLPALGNAGGFSPATVQDVNTDPVIQTMAQLRVPVPKPIVNVDGDDGPMPVTSQEAEQIQADEDGEFYGAVGDMMTLPEWNTWTPKMQQQTLREIRANIAKERYDKLLNLRTKEQGTSGLAGKP